MGASVFVLPVVQKLQSLDLSSRRIHVEIQGAVSKQGIRAKLQGSRSSRSAAPRTRSGPPPSGSCTSRPRSTSSPGEVLAGALRSIVGRLTIEEIIRDRAAFAVRWPRRPSTR